LLCFVSFHIDFNYTLLNKPFVPAIASLKAYAINSLVEIVTLRSVLWLCKELLIPIIQAFWTGFVARNTLMLTCGKATIKKRHREKIEMAF
jgi:hypothetical protein